MRQCQRPSAQGAILLESLELLDVTLVERNAALHVGKLANVELVALALAPTEENVGGTLGQALTDDHASAVIVERQLAVDVRRQHGGLGLLDLEEQRIVVVDALQQEHPAAGADAADAHDLAR